MPRQLPDELLEEVLRRLPPGEPAELVRAALVSRRWCRIVSDAGFRRRFREFHRRPPMLGMFCEHYSYNLELVSDFIPTTAFCNTGDYFWDMRALDSRHGRVLFVKGASDLVVWDPITEVVLRELPIPQEMVDWAAAILCSAVDCDHLDCHHGPFLIVFVCCDSNKFCDTFYTYSSDANAWSEPVYTHQENSLLEYRMGSALVGSSLYFGDMGVGTALKYDFESRQMSLIRLPSLPIIFLMRSRLITTMEGGLGLVNIDDSNLYLWTTKDTHNVDAKWETKVIELKTLFPDDVGLTKPYVFGTGVGIVIMRTGGCQVYKSYAIDLKTYKVNKVYEGTAHSIVPYMSFYTPKYNVALIFGS